MVEAEEESLSLMIRDYIELGSSRYSFYHLQTDFNEDAYRPKLASLKEILGVVTDIEKQILGKILVYLKERKAQNANNEIVMKLGLENFEACLCRTSWINTLGGPKALKFPGHYEYIEVKMMNGDNENVRLIIDIDFKSQFGLARPTPAYEELSNSIPSVFVGTEEKLKKIISLLCSAAKESLKERGLHVPPWRKGSYMESKWFSEGCKRIPFSELQT